MTTLAAPQIAARFKRGKLDVHNASGPVTLTGYRHVSGDEQGTPPWGITRDVANDKAWSVWHLPTGLLVRGGLPSLDAAKSLCAALENTAETAGRNLPALAAQPFGEPPKRETDGHREALAVWETLQAWLRSSRPGA